MIKYCSGKNRKNQNDKEIFITSQGDLVSEKAEKNPDSKELSYNLSHDADDRICKPYEGMDERVSFQKI